MVIANTAIDVNTYTKVSISRKMDKKLAATVRSHTAHKVPLPIKKIANVQIDMSSSIVPALRCSRKKISPCSRCNFIEIK